MQLIAMLKGVESLAYIQIVDLALLTTLSLPH